MRFMKIEDKVKSYKDKGFNHGDRVIALLNNGNVKHGYLFFIEDYQTMFEVQLMIDIVNGRSVDLFEAMVAKVETQ